MIRHKEREQRGDERARYEMTDGERTEGGEGREVSEERVLRREIREKR